jgi:hypothetical protein
LLTAFWFAVPQATKRQHIGDQIDPHGYRLVAEFRKHALSCSVEIAAMWEPSHSHGLGVLLFTEPPAPTKRFHGAEWGFFALSASEKDIGGNQGTSADLF